MKTPTTSCPASTRSAAATLESTPPERHATTREGWVIDVHHTQVSVLGVAAAEAVVPVAGEQRRRARHASPYKKTKKRARHASRPEEEDRKSTRLNSSHVKISYAVFC